MNEQTRSECIKALARGKSAEETAAVFGVSVNEVKNISQAEINEGKECLKKWGRL